MNYKIPPWAHQLEGIKRASARGSFAFFFEMGTGKTGTLINTLRAHFNREKRVSRTLIFCPPVVITNWVREWEMHSTVDLSLLHPLYGPGKKRAERLKALGEAPGIVITNYDSVLLPEVNRAIAAWGPEVFVFDESHKLKNPTAKRTKAVLKLVGPPGLERPKVFLLSGSPVLNSPADLFAQFLVLDGGQTFGSNFFAFRARYFTDRNQGMPKGRYFPNWQPKTLSRDGYGGLEGISQAIAPLSMRVKKAECLDLPPLVRTVIPCPMSPDQERIYNEMKQDFVAFLKSGEAVTAQLTITKALRLQQISSGFVKTVGGVERPLEQTPKMEALRELLEEITPHSKCLVWAVFKQNYAQIRAVCEAIGAPYVEVHGETSIKDRGEAVARFNSDPACRVYLGHPGSGGIGVNLVAASYSIFYSRNFSLENDLQAEARNHRGGSEIHEKITRYDLVSPGTIDEVVAKALANKQEVGEALLKSFNAC